MQPLAENLKMIDREMIAAYFQMLFQHVEDGYAVMLRGIGEQGTAQEGLFRENVNFPVDDTEARVNKGMSCAKRWGQHHVAAFCVPAAMDRSIFNDNKGEEDRVKLFTTVLVDLDKGDTDGALAWLTKYIGEPTMEVMSGGITETGQFKRHVYWALKEPTSEVAKVALVRGMIASKVGGDPSFKRIAQVVRIPGTVYAKGGVAKTCTIDKHRAHVEMELSDLVERANDMPMSHAALDVNLKADNQPSFVNLQTDNNRVSFAGFAGQDPAQPVGKQLVEPIHAGGEGDATRWSVFNEVYGSLLHAVRKGQLTPEDADARCRGWIAVNMTPPWQEERIVTEMRGLRAHDEKKYGPLVDLVKVPAAVAAQIKPPAPEFAFDMERWKAKNITAGEKPVRKFLVKQLIQCRAPHLFVAEGGAGKTSQALDLGLKVAAYRTGYTPSGGDPIMWWGEMLTEHCHDAAVVIVTAEDDEEEVHIRLKDMDEYNLLPLAGDRLHVVPLVNAGGAFPFVRNARTGEPEASHKLVALHRAIKAIPNVKLIIVDTMSSTLHGEDIKNEIIQQYFNILSPIANDVQSALVVTHHTRKGMTNAPVKTPKDMYDSIRGATAVRNSVRAVIGFWHALDYDKVMGKMGMRPKINTCYYAAVLKANNNEFYEGTKTLVRDQWGIFMDKTQSSAQAEKAIDRNEQKAWLLAAVARAVEDRQGLFKTGANGLYERREQLPDILRDPPNNKFLVKLAEELMAERENMSRKIVRVRVDDHKTNIFVLDVHGGKGDTQEKAFFDGGSWSVAWNSEYKYNAATMMVTRNKVATVSGFRAPSGNGVGGWKPETVEKN